VRELTEAISNVHISAGFSDLIDGNEAHLVKRWISLEDDPEIVASDDLLIASEVDEFLNASFAESFISISPCDSHLISQGDWDITEDITISIDHISDPETELRLNLLKYASEAYMLLVQNE
jgi:hypothetical protein